MAYYMLFQNEGGKWGPQFGDYDKETVEYERRGMIDGYQGLKAKDLKIVKLRNATNKAVEEAKNVLNSTKNPASKLSHLGELKRQGGGRVIITQRDLSNYWRQVTRGMKTILMSAKRYRKSAGTSTVYGIRIGNSSSKYALTNLGDAKEVARKLAKATGQRTVVFDKQEPHAMLYETGELRGGRFVANPRVIGRKTRTGSIRITKTEWNNKGGLSNSNLWRKQSRSGSWQYYERIA